MSENRYNVFNQIHKALRALLYDTAVCIQKTDFSSDAASAAIEKVALVVNLFDEHAYHEDTYLFPLVTAHNAALVAEFENDHEIDHKLSETLRDHIASWAAAGTAEQRIAVGQSIFYAFNEFIAFNLYHMNKEESVLLFTLWKHYPDTALLEAEHAIVQRIKPETLMIESQWMMRSLSNPEIIQWLTGVKMGAPEEVYATYLQLAQNELPAERWLVIETALQPTTAVA